MTLLAEIQSTHSVDSKRIYLTGVSLGGDGTWEIGLRHPERFAALVPVMGYYGWPFRAPENMCDLKEVPVWAFDGDQDDVLPLEAEQGLVDALEACGRDVRFTIYPGVGHDAEEEAYAEPELYDWLLSQKLE